MGQDEGQDQKDGLAQAIMVGRAYQDAESEWSQGYDPTPDAWKVAVPIMETAFAMNYSQSVDTYIEQVGLELGDEMHFSTREERMGWDVEE